MPRSSSVYSGSVRTTPVSPALADVDVPDARGCSGEAASAGTTASTISGGPSNPTVSVSAVGSTVGVRPMASTRASSPSRLSVEQDVVEDDGRVAVTDGGEQSACRSRGHGHAERRRSEVPVDPDDDDVV